MTVAADAAAAAAAVAAPAASGSGAIVPIVLLAMQSSLALQPSEPQSTVGLQELRSLLVKGSLQMYLASAPPHVPSLVDLHCACLMVSMHLA